MRIFVRSGTHGILRCSISPENSQLSKKLKGIRDQIVASGMPLLTPEEVEKEVLERRGGYQENICLPSAPLPQS